MLLDTSKAFDVVSHKGMLNVLHQQGITGQLCKLQVCMYTNINSVVKWKETTVHPYPFQRSSEPDKVGHPLQINIKLARTEY